MPFEPHALTPAELLLVVAEERAGSPFLAYRDASGELRLHPLGDSSRVTIGRHPDSDLVLAWDEEVSRAHAVLERIGGEWAIEDDRLPRNGSFVNGSRISGRRRLSHGPSHDEGRSSSNFACPEPKATRQLQHATELRSPGSRTLSGAVGGGLKGDLRRQAAQNRRQSKEIDALRRKLARLSGL